MVLPHISNISEDSLSPDIWQNIVCDDDFDNDYCGKEQNDRELELSQFQEGPLFDNVVVTDQIPDMTFFKEPSRRFFEECHGCTSYCCRELLVTHGLCCTAQAFWNCTVVTYS